MQGKPHTANRLQQTAIATVNSLLSQAVAVSSQLYAVCCMLYATRQDSAPSWHASE